MNPLLQYKPTILSLFIAGVLACFGLLPQAQAVVPAPDGGYPGFNTAEGINALKNLTTGAGNTAVGWYSLFSNTDGSFNTAVGTGTLLFNIGDQGTGEGTQNTAVGTAALLFNATGFANSAFGVAALESNTEGDNNTANGAFALFRNSEGGSNTAIGAGALNHNTTGDSNTANGVGALFFNTTGDSNTANGFNALQGNTTGGFNTALGSGSGLSITGSGNVCIGGGVFGVAGESNTTRIRNIYTTLQPVVGVDPDYVTVDSGGRLGRGNISSRRYKHDIKPMDKASETLFALKPVSFRYKKGIDPRQTLAFGLIAEEVAETNPDLVGRNPEGQPESVRYEQINTMLLNEFLKEHRKVEEQGTIIAQIKSTVAKQQADAAKQEAAIASQQQEIQTLAASLKEQASQIQKVSAQLQVSKFATGRIRRGGPAPQTVLNNQ